MQRTYKTDLPATIYTSRALLGLTWSEFRGLVACFELNCTVSRDVTFGEWVRFTPKDVAELLKQLCAMQENKSPSATVYNAMASVLQALYEKLAWTVEMRAVVPRNITIYQRNR